MDCLPIGKYSKIKKRIDDIDNELKTVLERYHQLEIVVKDRYDLKDMSEHEIYVHINALKHHAKSLAHYITSRNAVAVDIIDGWKIINERAENDPNLAEDWQGFLVTMKLTEDNEAIDG